MILAVKAIICRRRKDHLRAVHRRRALYVSVIIIVAESKSVSARVMIEPFLEVEHCVFAIIIVAHSVFVINLTQSSAMPEHFIIIRIKRSRWFGIKTKNLSMNPNKRKRLMP
jgi:hypothetical protein